MIKEIKLANQNVNFQSKSAKKDNKSNESEILPNTISTRVSQQYDKTLNSFIEYPAKGLAGHVNSDFYEFLAMGMIPYVIGSLTLMGLFNLVNHSLKPKSKIFAGNNGKKMALGVLLYGAGKNLTGDLVTKPVAMATGVDIELPYRNVYYPLPTEAGANANIMPEHQGRKVFDSREFFRKDLLEKDPRYGKAYYDKVAKKLGLGDDLNDPVTETTPIIQNIISTTKTAKSLSTYAWAAAGVGLAMQDSWTDFFDAVSNRRHHISKAGESFGSKISGKIKNFGHNTVDITKTFGKSFVKACKTLWTGEAGTSGFTKHAGKAWILFSAALTIGGVVNTVLRAKHMGKTVDKDLIDKSKESTVI